MAKKVNGYVKLQVPAGSANPSPPIGPALGQQGVNIMEFCKQFNARTQDKMGKVLPVLLTVYTDKSFDFVIKTPPGSAHLIGVALDRGHIQEIVGTICGDDTIFVACKGLGEAKDLASQFLALRRGPTH